MQIGSQYADNKMYRGIKHYDLMPLTSEDIHEHEDLNTAKNANIMNNIVGSGLLKVDYSMSMKSGMINQWGEQVSPAEFKSMKLIKPMTIMIDGDVSLINTDNSELASKEYINSLEEGAEVVDCLVGWYQHLNANSIMKNYGGVDNQTIPNTLNHDTLDMQVSSRYQFRWFRTMIDNADLGLQSVSHTISMRDEYGDKIRSAITALSTSSDNNTLLFSYKNELNAITGSSHYKLVGDQWKLVSTLPYPITENCGVVEYKGNIHLFGYLKDGKETSSHCVFDIDTWYLNNSLLLTNDEYYFSTTTVIGDKLCILFKRMNETYAHIFTNRATDIKKDILLTSEDYQTIGKIRVPLSACKYKNASVLVKDNTLYATGCQSESPSCSVFEIANNDCTHNEVSLPAGTNSAVIASTTESITIVGKDSENHVSQYVLDTTQGQCNSVNCNLPALGKLAVYNDRLSMLEDSGEMYFYTQEGWTQEDDIYYTVNFTRSNLRDGVYRADISRDNLDSFSYVEDDQLYLIPILKYKKLGGVVPLAVTTYELRAGVRFYNSEETPQGKFINGDTWYNPMTREFKFYVNGGFVEAASKMGFLQYHSVYTVTQNNGRGSTTTIPINVSTFQQGDILKVVYEGVELIPDTQYSVNYTDKTIILDDFITNIGDQVYITVTRIVEANDISNVTQTFTTHMNQRASSTIESHVKLTDTLSNSSASQGVAATPKLVKDAIDSAMTLTDESTGKKYKFGVKDGKLYVEEV